MDGAIEMYIPIYPGRLVQEPAPAELRLLLEVLDDRDWDALRASPGPLEFACEFWTRAEQLHPWVLQTLEAKYPGIQVRRCRVASVGLHEPTAVKAERSWWFAIESFLLAGCLFGGFLYVRLTRLSANRASTNQEEPSNSPS
jgi:hypothetical protein